jgi:UDP-N-acetylmuramate dehydrogenase
MQYQSNTLLKDYTTLKIGGPATYFAQPKSLNEMREVLAKAKEENLPLFILGNGSNVLVSDEGFKGIVLHMSKDWSKIERLDNNQVLVQAGATNEQLAAFCIEQGLGGYEFACGVPGTIGGAVMMNAGCYNGETKDVLVEVNYLDANGNLHVRKAKDLDLSYRHSWFTENFGLITQAIYQFEPKESAQVAAKVEELQKKRYDKQPMDKASCGSTFKRPEGHFAAALIDEAGLRGYRYKDAMVSEKHTGFLINDGQASAQDFLHLVEDVKEKVFENSGVQLECEVKMIGFDHEK